jgi:hypothetical protein
LPSELRYLSAMTTDSTTTSPPQQLDPFRIAAGMLRADILILVPFLALLSLTTIASTLVPLDRFSAVLALLIADRVLQLVVISLIALRWSARFESHGRSNYARITTARRIILWGFGIWCTLSLPRVLAEFVGNNGIQVALITSVGVGIFWSLRYYFFFAMTALLGKTIKNSAQSAILITRRQPQAALRSLLGPLGITALATVAVVALQPDGRSLWINACAASVEAVFWLLSTYTALAFAVVFIEEYDWRTAGLVPYRTDRLKTLEARGKSQIATLLSPATGIKLLALSLLVLFASLAREQRMPPAVSIHVKNVELYDYKVKATLEVSDPTYLFRGFKPAGFSVRTKSNTPVADELTKASLSADKDEVLLFMPNSDGSPRDLFVEFRSTKSRENLGSIENAWLWYQQFPVVALPLTEQPEEGVKEQPSATPAPALPQP